MYDFIGWIVDTERCCKLYNIQFEDVSRTNVVRKAKEFIMENWNLFKDIKNLLIVTKDNRNLPNEVVMRQINLECVKYNGIKSIPITVDMNYYKELKTI